MVRSEGLQKVEIMPPMNRSPLHHCFKAQLTPQPSARSSTGAEHQAVIKHKRRALLVTIAFTGASLVPRSH
jgi:hypothetical protein